MLSVFNATSLAIEIPLQLLKFVEAAGHGVLSPSWPEAVRSWELLRQVSHAIVTCSRETLFARRTVCKICKDVSVRLHGSLSLAHGSLHSGRAVKALTDNFEERGSLEVSVEARQYEVQRLQTVCEVGSWLCGGMNVLV